MVAVHWIGPFEVFDGGLNGRLCRVPHHKHLCVDLFLRGTMFTLFSQVLNGMGGRDYTRLAQILDLFFLYLSFFQFA